ncbi:Dioxygenase [Rhodoferax sp. OV413]|uniref:dioxygenase family protein n=1 Tax=Rhodoferax sp. OV413 TaxID=1855285 RepID=UPI00088E753F|nr:hypothetical protein [Rhodoferax sp. OV413]SDP86725.1 Dioxygenase [Rhodoferax sp. OV413]
MTPSASAAALLPLRPPVHSPLASAGMDEDSCVLSSMEVAGPALFSVGGAPLLRRDITEGRPGIPLSLTLQLRDCDNQGEAICGAEVYVWHCDAEGRYSGGHSGPEITAIGETYLRGVQFSNQAGSVVFHTILPGCHQCQLEHIHLLVLLPSTVPSSRTVSTASAQLLFPYAVTTAAYSCSTLYRPSLDMQPPAHAAEPADSPSQHTLQVSGNASTGYAASLVIGITSV